MSFNRQATKRTRTVRRVGAVVAAFALVMGGCQSAGSGADDNVAVIVTDADPESLNPAIAAGNAVGDVASKIFEGLVWVDKNQEVRPALATDWKVSKDGRVYDFTLRKGVLWHDGEPFTAADVKFSLEEVLAKYNARTQEALANVSDVEVDGKRSLTVTLKQPYAPFLRQMNVFDAPIIPKHVYEGTDILKNDANRKPIGTGPFVFGKWDRGSSITLERNEDYWDGKKPHLDGLIFQIIPEPSNRAIALENGEADYVYSFYLSPTDVKRLEKNPDLQTRRGVGDPSIEFLMFDTTEGPLADRKVRQALALAIDRKRIVRQAASGLGRPAVGAFGDGFEWLVNDEVSYERKYQLNRERARQLLRDAGVKKGTKLDFTFYTGRPFYDAVADIVKDDLKKIGLDVRIAPVERSVWIDKVFMERDFDISLQSFISNGDPAVGYHRIYHTVDEPTQFANATGYSKPKVDELLLDATRTVEKRKRAVHYKKAQEILNEDLPCLVLFDGVAVDAASKNITGLWAGSNGRDRWGDVRLVE